MAVGNSGLSFLLLLLLHFSKAQYSEEIQPVCLIAFHFQEVSLLAQIHTSDDWGEPQEVLL